MATYETNLGALLFGAYRRQVLALLLMHPEQSFHVRFPSDLTLACILRRRKISRTREMTVFPGAINWIRTASTIHYRPGIGNGAASPALFTSNA